jgi:Tol biopolymer transport system component
MKHLSALTLLFVSASCIAQTGSEILLFDLASKKGKLTLSNPKNITNHKGYDNQPSFHSSEPLIYYSSFYEDGRSDIKIYNYKTRETKSLTQTTEREYSPTLTPDSKFISCIIQRDSGAQDLGKYPVQGGVPTVLIDNLIVGYHAWLDKDRVMCFVLGEPQTLHVYNVKTKEDKVVADNIGRSLHRIPGKNAMSFVKKTTDTEWSVMQLDIETLAITKLIDTMPQREDLCWSPEERIIMSNGTKIYSIDPSKGLPTGQAGKEWSELEVKSGSELLKGVTRLAINKKGDKLAVVVTE